MRTKKFKVNAMRKHEKTSYSKNTDKVICNERNIFCSAHLDDMGQYSIDSKYYEKTYTALIAKIVHGEKHIFGSGGHPAIVSNAESFARIATEFLVKQQRQK